MIALRYLENTGNIISQEEQVLLNKKIIGVIGVGSFLLEFLCRMGVKKIIAFDGDIWEEKDLCQKTFSNEEDLGQYKMESILKQSKKINSTIEYEFYSRNFTSNDLSLLQNIDLLFISADLPTDLYHSLFKFLQQNNIPCVIGYQTDETLISRYFNTNNYDSFNSFLNMLKSTFIPESGIISCPSYYSAILYALMMNQGVDLLLNRNNSIHYVGFNYFHFYFFGETERLGV